MSPLHTNAQYLINTEVEPSFKTQIIYLKLDAFNVILMAYMRHIHANEFNRKVPIIGKPLAIRFELFCMNEYLKLLKFYL